MHLFGGEKLFEAERKETLIAYSKYDSLPLGLKYVIAHSLLSPGVKLLGSWVVQSWKVLGTGAAAHAEEARCQSGCN